MNCDDYDYDDDEQTSITDTQPISKDLVVLHDEMKELHEICVQATIKLRAVAVGPGTATATVDGVGV